MKLLKFQADWCGPCKMQTSILNQIKEKINVPIEVIDIDIQMDKAREYDVRAVPTLVLINEEGEIKRHTGVLREPELLKFLGP